MNAKIISKNAVVLLLLVAGYFSACTSELEIKVSEKVIDTRVMEFTEASQFYYYYGNERQYLQLNTRYMFVSMSDESIVNVLALANIRHQPLNVDIPEEMQSTKSRTVTAHHRFYTVLSFDEAMSEDMYWTQLSEVKNLTNGLIVAPFFKNRYHDKIGLTNYFYVRLKNLNDLDLLKQKAEEKHVIIVHQNEFMPLWHVLSITESSVYNAMEMANHFHRSGLFQYAEPDFIIEDQLNCATDEFFWLQWGLRNGIQFNGRGIDINVCNAWQISTGSNVIVAVLDHGIDLNHPDLRDNIFPLSFDSQSGTSPQRLLGDHGTPVAGIIGAKNNNNREGIAGVSPDSQIMSISNSLRGTRRSRQRRADGINWAWQNGADVINNSWSSGIRHRIIDDAISNAVRNGRNGRGSVIVFSSGNDHRASVSYPACLSNVIAVGSINRNGQRASSSNFGTALDVVAPGVNIRTTTLDGYADVSGTSAAAPHVAGVVALMLSVNPVLTAQQVRNIIESTANRNLPGVTFATAPGRPNGTWNRYVGHGLVDAYAAVRAAQNAGITVAGSTFVCPGTTNAGFTLQNHPADATVRWSVSGFLAIEEANNQSTVRVRHTGGPQGLTLNTTSQLQVEVIQNGQVINTLQRDVVVNRPTIQSITNVDFLGRLVHTPIHIGGPVFFAANHNCQAVGTSVIWSVTPNHGVMMTPWTPNNLAQMGFTFPGNYTITASVTNACGTHTMSRNITVTGTSPHPIVICHYCGTPSNMPPGCWRCPATALPDPLRDPDDPIEY